MKEFHDVTVYVRIIKICILKGLTIPIVCSSSQVQGLMYGQYWNCLPSIGSSKSSIKNVQFESSSLF